jgi:C4-dicarboxylate transporter DctM subunit
VVDLFTAGIGPGILMLLVFSAYGLWVNRRMPSKKFDTAEFKAACREGIWAALLPVILLGGIYSGYFTATEAAAVALLYALVIEIWVHKEMRPRDFYQVVLDQSKLGGSLFPVLAVALSLNIVLVEHRVPGQMVEFMQSFISSPLMFMLLVNMLLLVVGCLMTTGEAILILAPLLMPVAEAYGYNKVLFGIIMILNLEIGFLTPPVGLNLLVAMSVFKRKFGELVLAAVPFIVLMLGCLAVIVWQPWISLSLLGR